MIHEIEERVKERVTEKLVSVRDVKIQKGGIHMALVKPEVFVSCEKGAFKFIAQKWKQELDVYIEIAFKDLTGEQARRKGATIIVEAILQYMIGQKLGLAITPMEPSGWEHITDAEDVTAGLIRYQLLLKTDCFLEKFDEEEITDLFRVGLNYFLKPGDEIVDAQDIVELGQ